MRNDFLTIPDTPNYEINSQLICRNKFTKQTLTLHPRPGKAPYYSLRNKFTTKFTIKRSPELLRRQAVAAAKPDTFEPIPSTGGKYEISPRGVVRNSHSKHILKRKSHGHCVQLLLDNGSYVVRSIKDLLWEVHGIILPRRFRPQPCSAENQHGKFFFQNMKACARFLAPKIFLSVRTIANYLYRHDKFIGEWSINYL